MSEKGAMEKDGRFFHGGKWTLYLSDLKEGWREGSGGEERGREGKGKEIWGIKLQNSP